MLKPTFHHALKIDQHPVVDIRTDAMDKCRAPRQQINNTRNNALKTKVSASNKEKKCTHLKYIEECLSVGEMGGGDVVKVLQVLPPWEMCHPAIHVKTV